MTRRGIFLAFFVATLVAGCVSRVPVVTSPTYPDFLFPAVPEDYVGSSEVGRHQEAWAYLQTGDLAGAEQRFAALLERDPSFYPAEAALGWVGVAQSNHEDAIDRFDRAIARAPVYVSALVGRGKALLATDQMEAALESYEAALSVEPQLSDVERVVQEIRFTIMAGQLGSAREAAVARRFTEAAAAYERVISSSPESAFLYIELARVEQSLGDLSGALVHVRQASELDPYDPVVFLFEGELHEVAGDLMLAEAAYRRANQLQPTEDTASRLRRVRELSRLAELPTEYRNISTSLALTRGELAVLVGVRLSGLLAEASSDRAVIITDTRNYWGNSWILAVTQARIMDVDAGYRFEPERAVRRSELAEVVAAVLTVIASRDAEGAQHWQNAQPRFSDMEPDHLQYSPAALAVASGVLSAREGNAFQPTATVTGAEGIESIGRLDAIAGESH